MLHVKASTGSTNDDARALALAGAASGEAVLAHAQTGGRGRAGRSWESPEGGFYLSVVLRPTCPPTSWGLLPLALGAAAAHALRERGFPVDVKWPNDLLIGSAKVGGLLVESRLGPGGFAVAGIGINLTEVPHPVATSLARHGAPPEARALAEALVAAFLRVTDQLDAGRSRALLDDVRAVCVSLGRRVRWDGREGRAVDIDEDGALVVDAADEGTMRVVAGDVSVVWD